MFPLVATGTLMVEGVRGGCEDDEQVDGGDEVITTVDDDDDDGERVPFGSCCFNV